MLAGLQHAGRDPALLLERAHIAAQVLNDPQARIPVARYAELYNLINRELDDEGFGLFSLPHALRQLRISLSQRYHCADAGRGD
jgi:hypothetical protein